MPLAQTVANGKEQWVNYIIICVFGSKPFSFVSYVLQITSKASDPDIGLTITSCFISPNSSPTVSSDYKLIETVCAEDNSLKWIQNPQRHLLFSGKMGESFSFTFNSKTLNSAVIFLHCEMSLCSEDSQRNQELPQVCMKSSYDLCFCSCLMSCSL